MWYKEGHKIKSVLPRYIEQLAHSGARHTRHQIRKHIQAE